MTDAAVRPGEDPPEAGGSRFDGAAVARLERLLGRPWLWAAVAGLAAASIAAFAIDATGPATIDPDASASVLYFQRLVAGRHLEAFVPTTPKPLLTLVYGVTWSLLHDWRAVVWLTVAAQAAAVAGAAYLAWMVARGIGVPGTRAARLFAGTVAAGVLVGGLVGWRDELLEVSRANSLVWVLAAWAAAACALAASPRRWGVAGAALLLAGLLRVESWLLIGLALAWTAWLTLAGDRVAGWRQWSAGRRTPAGARERGQRSAGRRTPAGARQRGPGEWRRTPVRPGPWRLWIAALAFPAWWLHDLLLTGDPLFSLSVPSRYTPLYAPGVRPEDPVAFLGPVVERYAGEPVLVALAIAGVVLLVAANRPWPAAALVVLAGGDLVLLTSLAARGTYVSARYFETIDAALLCAAALGAGALVARAGPSVFERLAERGRTWRRLAAAFALGDRRHGAGRPVRPAVVTTAVGGLVLGVALVWPPGPADVATAERLERVRVASADMPGAVSALATLIPPGTGWQLVGRDPSGAPDADPASALLYAPSTLRSRVAIELDLPLTAVVDSLAAYLPYGPGAVLRPGQIVWHDAAADPSTAAYRPLFEPFELETPARVGTVRVQPVWVRPGSWIVRIEAPRPAVARYARPAFRPAPPDHTCRDWYPAARKYVLPRPNGSGTIVSRDPRTAPVHTPPPGPAGRFHEGHSSWRPWQSTRSGRC